LCDTEGGVDLVDKCLRSNKAFRRSCKKQGKFERIVVVVEHS
jgi:hypothetical protein